jgi:hypothetical protein
MNKPTSVRFEPELSQRLTSWAIAHGSTVSGAVNQLLDEKLRMEEFPGIVFRDGPTGRRAGLSGGIDVWDLVRVVNEVRQARPKLTGEKLVGVVADELGLSPAQVRLAIGYYAAFPEETDARIAAAEEASARSEQAWRVQQRLLA